MMPYEPYHLDCPRCGYPESIDRGPYEPSPLDEGLWPPLDPRVHCLWCGRCGKPFDVIDDGVDAA